ncbi:MAG: DUF1080 domain-containing protein [Verrucomicrobiota bacterium]
MTYSCGYAKDTWITLFNGVDLAGWKPNVHPKSWAVEEGAIKAQATNKYSHLFYVGHSKTDSYRTFDDFILELEVRTGPSANGGIYFHTDFDARGQRHALTKGYELQINSSELEKRKTGSLYKVVDLDQSPVDETSWFKVRLTVKGKRITIEINNQVVVDYLEPAEIQRERKLLDKGGAIALQAHDPDSVVYYRKIRIKEL